MKIYKSQDNTQPSGFALHSLSDQDIANGAEGLLPTSCTEISEAEAEEIRAANTPVPQAPQFVTMRQARLALLQAGLLQTVNDAIAAMPGIEGDAARIEWEFSSEVHRNKALVQSLAPALGMNDSQLDQLFTAASTL